MTEITVDSLSSSISSQIDSINQYIKSNRLGLKAINELNKQKSILSSHVNDLLGKDDVSKEDEKNTTRLIAIATNKQLTAQPKGNDTSLVIGGVVIILASVAIYYYYKKD
jgi:hypothetical protein